MISRTLNASACSDETRIVTIVDLPPKEPREDEDENEEDEEDDDEEDDGPAAIREPDEC
jgi:hypothetical protein